MMFLVFRSDALILLSNIIFPILMMFTSAAKVEEEIAELRSLVANLAKQTMAQQLFVEERIRSSGSSGIKTTRTRLLGNQNYFASTHVSGGIAAIHDHANYQNAVGMGETVVVLNGVEFRTRHNDYKIIRPSTTNKTFGAIEVVDTPEVPPEVTAKKTVAGQIEEMREWFKAFKEQNYTVRDYRKYFKPVLCYIEGGWTLDEKLNEPFESDRHELVAESWDELQQQIRYTSYTGTKDLKENFSYLPTTIMGVNKATGKPIYAQWNYRILCHPAGIDIPTKYFRQQDDLAYRESTGRTMDRVATTRAARFRLSRFNEPKFQGANSLLDQIFKQIPGRDNIPGMLNEAPFGIPVFDLRYSNNNTLLNTGFYHRSFKTNKRGAMGLMNIYRGFNDEALFVAETTQPNIASESFKYCKKKNRLCSTTSARFTYAIPLEIIFLTPLTKWNPYNVKIWDDKDSPKKNGRNGKLTKEKAYNGASTKNYFYITPAEFYKSSEPDEKDPADTTQFGVGVLDKKGKVRRMAGSGTRVLSLPIEGTGRIRLRYPIPPIHGEGSSVWKELSVVKRHLKEMQIISKATRYFLELQSTSVGGLHKHGFFLTLEQWDDLQEGEIVKVTTMMENGHNHELEVWINPKRKSRTPEYKTCDGKEICWDRHWKKLVIKETPTSE